MKSVMDTSSLSTRHWITKRAAQECGANAILFKRRQRPDDKFPFCGETASALHVYKCQNTNDVDVWRQCIYKLEEVLRQHQTDPNITIQLSQGLLQWQQNQLVGAKEYIIQQSQIG
jgi:hypothetical protein